MDTFSAKFGKILREIRNRRAFSQEKLAEIAGLDRTFVSMIERGRRRPTLDTAKKLAEALDVPLSRMIRMTERRKAHVPAAVRNRSGSSKRNFDPSR